MGDDVVARARAFVDADHIDATPRSNAAKEIITELLGKIDGGPLLGRFVLPYPITANDFWRTRAIISKGKPMAIVYQTQEAEAWKEHAGLIAKTKGFLSPTDRPVALRIVHHHKALVYSKHLQRKIRNGNVFDLDNVLKVSIDGLKKIVFHDDKQVKHIEAGYGDETEAGALTVEVREFIPPQAELFRIEPPPARRKPDDMPF